MRTGNSFHMSLAELFGALMATLFGVSALFEIDLGRACSRLDFQSMETGTFCRELRPFK